MRSLFRYVPNKGVLLLLFVCAKWRIARQTAAAEDLSAARIDSATEELNKIADDIRDAEPAPESPLSAGTSDANDSAGDMDADPPATHAKA